MIKAEYIVKQDLINMLEKLILEIKEEKTVLFEVESNIGGKLTAEFKKDELPYLREKIE